MLIFFITIFSLGGRASFKSILLNSCPFLPSPLESTLTTHSSNLPSFLCAALTNEGLASARKTHFSSLKNTLPLRKTWHSASNFNAGKTTSLIVCAGCSHERNERMAVVRGKKVLPDIENHTAFFRDGSLRTMFELFTLLKALHQ